MKRLIRILPLFLLTALLGGLVAFRLILGGLPAPQALGDRLPMPSIRITDRTGRLLYEVMDGQHGRQTTLPLDQIPLALRQATIATEDRNFYQNPGVDLEGILRAFWMNMRGGEVLAGGSTITQQVARNLMLEADEWSQRTVRRKLRESWMAWQLARVIDKEEILGVYLNQMYYGALAYGVEAAAQTYFGKSAAELTLAESALIAGLTQAPSVYNPLVNPDAAKERQLVVLGLMREAGYIHQAEYELAVREPLHYSATPYPVMAPHFVMMVQDEMDSLFSQEERYRSGGLSVRTTLDLNWQLRAEEMAAEHLRRLAAPPQGGPGHNARNLALVALDPQNGDVLALVGNGDYFDEATSGAINMAIAPRQPGSALKPIVYAAAMSPDQSVPWTAASMIPDVRTVFETRKGEAYVPLDFSREEHGPVLLRQALASSLNIPAVHVLDAIGLEAALTMAADMGVEITDDPNEVDLSLVLGGNAVKLLDLTSAYGIFANGGWRIPPRLILEVNDASGKVLFAEEAPEPIRVLDERVAWLISDILSDDQARQLSFGSNSVLKLDRPVAVKTGTTNDFRDNWTVGYTPDLVVGVWVGNADHEPMQNVTGISGAGPVWHNFMRTALAGEPGRPFERPPGLVQAEVCVLSGMSPGEECPYRRGEWFLAGTQPVEQDTFYKRVTLDRWTGTLANELTPLEQQVTQLALDLPAQLQPWARANDLVLLDDLLRASNGEGGYAEGSAASASGGPVLRLVSPVPQSVYRISAALPREAQRLRLEMIGPSSFTEVTLWVDGVLLVTLDHPPFEAWWPLDAGRHQAWAEGRDMTGARYTSPPIEFEVRDINEG